MHQKKRHTTNYCHLIIFKCIVFANDSKYAFYDANASEKELPDKLFSCKMSIILANFLNLSHEKN